MKTCTELYVRRGALPRLAVSRETLWKPGQEITISFIGGDKFQRGYTMEYMVEWLLHANIRFKFLENGKKGQVRIAFKQGDGSWSYVGKQALFVKADEPTMNFGWLDRDTDQKEWERVVVHEAGHMLGAIHEHQSPAAKIQWNKPVVYDYYWKTQQWSKQQVDQNIFETYSRGVTNSVFDPDSIMLYPIPPEFTLDGFTTGWNTSLSERDKEFIGEVYP